MDKGFKGVFLSKLSNLNKDQRIIFNRIYDVLENTGELVPPVEMISWIESNFGSVDSVKHQEFLRITDKITYEGAIFNELRTKRPVIGDKHFTELLDVIEAAKTGPFAHPLTGTPADVFGRVQGKYCVTASNIAKYDGLHGLVIFKDTDPLLFSRKRARDYFNVAKEWYKKAHGYKKDAIYPLYTWNCMWRASASIVHGHCQLALASSQAYTKIEHLRSLTLDYQETHRSNYFDDVYKIHESLGLAFTRNNIKLIVKLTPIKEKEIMILSSDMSDNLADLVSDTLTSYKEVLGVNSFNLSIILPPLETTPEVWTHMPVITRIVDRGRLSQKTADFGAMELYAQSIIESNPYIINEKLKKSLIKNAS